MFGPTPSYLSSQSVSIRNFYHQLSLQMKQIQNMKIKDKINHSLHQQQLVFPNIGKKGRQKHAKSHHGKELQNRANQLQLRLYRLEKQNQQFSKSKSKKNQGYNYYKHLEMMQPFPRFTKEGEEKNPSRDHFLGRQGQKKQSSIKKVKSDYLLSEVENSMSKGRKSHKMSEARRNLVKKRLRAVLIAVYFIPVFKTYSNLIFKKKCERLVQIHAILNQEQKQLESDFYQILIKFDLFEVFYQISQLHEPKNAEEKEKDQVKVEYEQDQISISMKISNLFIEYMLIQMKKSMERGQLDIMYPILLSLVTGELPLSDFFFQQELNVIKLNPKKGSLEISESLSKMLMTNFIFIKIILNKLLVEKKVFGMILKNTKKKPGRKKFYVLYGKKLNITLILFYQTINCIFFAGVKRLTSNMSQVPQKVQIAPRPELSFDFSSIKFEQDIGFGKEQRLSLHLLKDIKCPQKLKDIFLSQFEKNWGKIREITNELYKKMFVFRKQQLSMIKQSILSGGDFGTSSNISQILEWKYSLKMEGSNNLWKTNTFLSSLKLQKAKGEKNYQGKKIKK